MNKTGMAACGLAVCLGVLTAKQAYAFEQAGFHSGMTLAEAKEIALNYGTPLTKMNIGNVNSYSIGEPPKSKGVVQFCHDRLYFISQNIPGEVDAFAEHVEAFARQFGAPGVSAASGHTQDGFMSYVTLEWSTPEGEKVTASISRFQERSWASVTKTASGICK